MKADGKPFAFIFCKGCDGSECIRQKGCACICALFGVLCRHSSCPVRKGGCRNMLCGGHAFSCFISDFIKEEYSIKFEKLEGIVESIESLKIASTAALAGNYYVNDKICIEYYILYKI